MDFDKVLHRVGPCGRYQVYNYVLLGISGMMTGMHNLASVFLVGAPEHWCRITELSNLTRENQQRMSSPWTKKNGKSVYSECSNYKQNYTHSFINEMMTDNQSSVPNDTEVVSCSEWNYDTQFYHTTIVSEWDLVCSESWKRALAPSLYMLGFLFGTVIFGSLSDRMGRKLSWFMSLLLLITSGTIAAFLPNYWSHVILRMVSGTAAAGMFTCGFVILMEIIGTEYRMKPGVFYQGWFAFGYMTLAGIAYFIRDYRWLQLTISVVPCIFLSYWCLIEESPRWMLTQGLKTRAKREVERIARMNRTEFPIDVFEEEADHLKKQQEVHLTKQTYSILDLVKTPNMRKKSLNVFFNWFVNSLVYYGLSLGVSDLAGGPHLNLFISGAVEFPGFIFAVLLLDKIGRRWPLSILMVGGGIACLIILIIPPEMSTLTTVLAMTGKLGISGSFAIIYVFSAELFPTVVRTIGVGAGSMSARIGGLIAPFVAELGRLVWGPLPLIIFGTTSVAAGLLALLLPETLHQHLPETLEDGENFGKRNATCDPINGVTVEDNEDMRNGKVFKDMADAKL